jgi:hypothetical protein
MTGFHTMLILVLLLKHSLPGAEFILGRSFLSKSKSMSMKLRSGAGFQLERGVG